jgi:hypothetical protein
MVSNPQSKEIKRQIFTSLRTLAKKATRLTETAQPGIAK